MIIFNLTETIQMQNCQLLLLFLKSSNALNVLKVYCVNAICFSIFLKQVNIDT